MPAPFINNLISIFFIGLQPHTLLEEYGLKKGLLKPGYNPMSLMPWTARKLLWNPEPMGKEFGRICLEAFDTNPNDFGRTVMNLLEKKIKPREIVTKKSLENAATIVAATGGSTNAALHLPALANEIGVKFDLMDVAKIFKKTPYLADLKPGGKYVAKDMWEAGGVPMLLKTLFDGGYIHGECMTVTGKTMKENLANIKFNTNQKVLREYNLSLIHI